MKTTSRQRFNDAYAFAFIRLGARSGGFETVNGFHVQRTLINGVEVLRSEIPEGKTDEHADARFFIGSNARLEKLLAKLDAVTAERGGVPPLSLGAIR